jgi:hypothetical protein
MSLDDVNAAYFHCSDLARPGNAELQIDLKLDYRRNIARYPLYQDYFRRRQPKLLAVWDRHDPFFAPTRGGIRRDIPAARIVLLETGHFALETDGGKVGRKLEG